MNISMIDITDIPTVKLENEVTLLGSDNEEQISADRLALWDQSINYEILSRLSSETYRMIVP